MAEKNKWMVHLPVAFVFLSVLLGTKLEGPWGAFLGVPIFALFYSMMIAFADRAKSGKQFLKPVEMEEGKGDKGGGKAREPAGAAV